MGSWAMGRVESRRSVTVDPAYLLPPLSGRGAGLVFQHRSANLLRWPDHSGTHCGAKSSSAPTALWSATAVWRTDPQRLREVPRAQRRALAKPLSAFADQSATRREAMAQAFLSGAYTMQEIAEHFGVHYSTVSRAVRRIERAALGSAEPGSSDRIRGCVG